MSYTLPNGNVTSSFLYNKSDKWPLLKSFFPTDYQWLSRANYQPQNPGSHIWYILTAVVAKGVSLCSLKMLWKRLRMNSNRKSVIKVRKRYNSTLKTTKLATEKYISVTTVSKTINNEVKRNLRHCYYKGKCTKRRDPKLHWIYCNITKL